MTQEEYKLICSYIKERKNILVGGGTGSGKSTLTNAIIQKMTEYTPNDNFYIVEDVPELQCNAHKKNIIYVKPIHTEKDMKVNNIIIAIRWILRWAPDRIIFGEVRDGEVANELINAWNTGPTGNVASIHADSGASMLKRMEDLLREVIPGSIPKLSNTILSNTIHLCVHMAGGKQGPHVDAVLQNDI